MRDDGTAAKAHPTKKDADRNGKPHHAFKLDFKISDEN